MGIDRLTLTVEVLLILALIASSFIRPEFHVLEYAFAWR
jgi:hypothetical protein